MKQIYVIKIACGQDSIAILTNMGKLFTYGLNDAGQLGLNYPNDVFVNCPKEVKFPDVNYFVIDIAGGDKHYIALVKNIETNLFTWGLNQGIEPIDLASDIIKEVILTQSKIPVLKSDFINKNIIKI